MDRTYEGKSYRMLNVVDEYSRECLAIKIKSSLNSFDVIDVLSELFLIHGVPDYIRSDNGSEFVAKALREWLESIKC